MANYSQGDKVEITGGYYKGEVGKIAYSHGNGKYAVNLVHRATLVQDVPKEWLKRK